MMRSGIEKEEGKGGERGRADLLLLDGIGVGVGVSGAERNGSGSGGDFTSGR